MKYLKLNNDLEVSQLVFGCMRISEMSVSELDELIQCALEEGINFFDHADIYGGGKSEVLFGEVLKLHPESNSFRATAASTDCTRAIAIADVYKRQERNSSTPACLRPFTHCFSA